MSLFINKEHLFTCNNQSNANVSVKVCDKDNELLITFNTDNENDVKAVYLLQFDDADDDSGNVEIFINGMDEQLLKDIVTPLKSINPEIEFLNDDGKAFFNQDNTPKLLENANFSDLLNAMEKLGYFAVSAWNVDDIACSLSIIYDLDIADDIELVAERLQGIHDLAEFVEFVQSKLDRWFYKSDICYDRDSFTEHLEMAISHYEQEFNTTISVIE
ncbi:hypothetical protein ACFBZI_11635 [Moraxella sp. ZJ142]|uniref:hypothetical protein n=1 Tax=Moraxella marmotae TaxID=3344520 RepID=UPI0035D4708C